MPPAVAASRCEQRFGLGLHRTRAQSLARSVGQQRCRLGLELARSRAVRKRSEGAGKYRYEATDALDRKAAKKDAQKTRARASRQPGWGWNSGRCIASGCGDCPIRRAI